MDKIIFLDIDGVISHIMSKYKIDPLKAFFIQWICENSEYKIVISSTWRNLYDLDFFQKIFGKSNILLDDWKTKISQNRRRGDEIDDYLDRHNIDKINGKYLILDDDIHDFNEHQMSKHIHTDAHEGIRYDTMIAILEYCGLRDIWRKKYYNDYNIFLKRIYGDNLYDNVDY